MKKLIFLCLIVLGSSAQAEMNVDMPGFYVSTSDEGVQINTGSVYVSTGDEDVQVNAGDVNIKIAESKSKEDNLFDYMDNAIEDAIESDFYHDPDMD
jgi:hypothetical protein